MVLDVEESDRREHEDVILQLGARSSREMFLVLVYSER